ncbi:glycosyltransferase family 4 protein [Sphaerisporangium aureirubrum]|uniref:Glycosyltransferase family 4 protein n=1 Tax=Sphaerisporangium aureirubrum TaxID=1544736 RepID=A0ABW1NC20_9ACTN
MRILLAQNMFHLPTHGGANKSNRIMLEQLAARGHTCRVVAPLSGALRRTSLARHLAYLENAGALIRSVTDEAVTYEYRGVVAHAVVNPSHLARWVGMVSDALNPDWILVPSDDPGLIMLGAASRAAPGRIVYLAHTLQQLPFGPGAFYPSSAGTRLVRSAAGVVAVSRAARDHLLRWAAVESTLIHPQVYERGPAAAPGPAGGAVTMVNPCAYKGLPIFLALADARPGVRFLAVPTWGATEDDLEALRRRPNIELMDPVDDIGEVLARTRVLVMPSLWDETFGYTAVEAMLRGVPVLASDVGGLSEAKLGVPYLLPVRRISGYEAGSHARPVPIVPEQDAGPWLDALDLLLTDPAHHRDVAERSERAAAAFVAALDEDALDRYLTTLTPAEAPVTSPAASGLGDPPSARSLATVARRRAKALTPERRAALAALLAAHSAQDPPKPPPPPPSEQGDNAP